MTLEQQEILIIIEHGQVKTVLVSNDNMILKTAVVDLDYMHNNNKPLICNGKVHRMDSFNLLKQFPSDCDISEFIRTEFEQLSYPGKKAKRVLKFDSKGKQVGNYRSAAIAGARSGMSKESVYRSINRGKIVKGFKFEYAE